MATCWHCGRDQTTLTLEHIVPQRWGGRLTTRSCGECNALAAQVERLAEEVPWVQRALGLAGVRGRSGKLQEPRAEAQYPDGSRGVIAYTIAGLTPVVFKPRWVGVDGDGREIWEVPAQQITKFRKRVEQRGQEVEIREQAAPSYEGAEVEYGLGPPNISLWPRLGAKLALGCASLAFDRSWLESHGACGLQTLFVHDRGPGYNLGVLPTELDEEHALYDLLDADEHLLLFQPHPDGGATFAVILFGSIQYALHVPDTSAHQRPTWLLRANHPAEREPEPFEAVFARLLERAQQHDPTGRWSAD
jgi:hypothetical protein